MKHQKHLLRTLSSGHAYYLETYTYTPPSDSKGILYLQAALHGSEIQGISVIYAFIQRLQHMAFPYTVKVVPFANPMALDTRMGEYTYGRFDPKTGINWNRGFTNLLAASRCFTEFDMETFINASKEKGFSEVCAQFEVMLQSRVETLLADTHVWAPEEKLALLLHREALGARYVFDLHCDSISVPYLYLPAYLVSDRLKQFQSDYFITTPCQFTPSFNQAIFYPWWVFTKKWNLLTGQSQRPPLHSFTYELGSKEQIDLLEGQRLLDGIVSYITADEKPAPDTKKIYICAEANYSRLRAPIGGLVAYDDAILGRMQAPQTPLAHFLTKDRITQGLQEIPLMHPKKTIPLTRTATSLVHAGDEVIKVMTDFDVG